MKKIILGIFGILFLYSSFAFARDSKPHFVNNIPDDVGLVNILDNWQDLPAVSTSAILNAVSIATATLAAGSTTYASGFTDVIFPRNITADSDFATGEATTTVSGILTITGYNQFGRAVTETLSISTNSVTGSVCWSSITSMTFSGFTITGASESSIVLYVGTGFKIGLSNNIQSSTDVIKVIEAGATSTTYTADATYDTIQFADAPDGSKDYYVYYEARTNTDIYKY